jgi:hypothetical protein
MLGNSANDSRQFLGTIAIAPLNNVDLKLQQYLLGLVRDHAQLRVRLQIRARQIRVDLSVSLTTRPPLNSSLLNGFPSIFHVSLTM